MLSPARRRARAGAPALGRARLSGVTPGTGGTTARQRVRAAALQRGPAHARGASAGPASRTCPPMPASAHVTDLARALTAAFLAGTWHADALARRGRDALAPRPAWLPRVARAVVGASHHPPHDRPRELATFVALQLDGLPEPRRGELAGVRVRRWFLPTGRMADARPWPAIPALDTVGDLAAWLQVGDGRLAWLADVRGWER